MSMALCLVMLASVLPMSGFTAEATASTATGTAAPAATAEPTGTAAPAATPAPTATATPDDDTPAPAATPEVTATPAPTAAPEATVAPEGTDATEADAAVAAAQAQIDALPTAEELTALLTAMNAAETDGDEAAYNAAAEQFGAACDSYAAARAACDALTPDQKARLDTARLTAFESFIAELYGTEMLTGGEGGAGDIVAKIGETEYQTLAAALVNVTDGETITLLKDTSEDGYTFGNESVKCFTIELNGWNVENPIDLGNKDIALTVKNSSTSGTGSITVYNSMDNGSLTVEGGEVTFGDADNTSAINNISVTGGKLIISTGINGEYNTVSSLNVSGDDTSVDIQNGKVKLDSLGNATVNIAGGVVNIPDSDVTNGIGGTLNVMGGTLNIPGCSVTGLKVSQSGTVNITGGKVENPVISGGTVTITGGTIAQGSLANGEITTPTISGGTINVESGGTVEPLTAKGGTINANDGTLEELNVTDGDVTVKKGESADTSKVDTLNISYGTVNVATEVTTLNANTNSSTINVQSGGTITTLNVNFVSGSTANVTLKGELPTAADTYNVNTINATGGTLTLDFTEPENYYSGSYNVKKLTVNGGTLTVNKGYINLLESKSGKVNINVAPEQMTFNGYAVYKEPVNQLNYYGGTLSIADSAHSGALEVKWPIIATLYVVEGNPKLKNGVFGGINVSTNGIELLDLLDDGYAIFNEDGEVCNVRGETNTGNKFSGKDPFYIGSHTCDFKEDKASFFEGVQCACGQTCPHTSIDKDGKCEACPTQFAIVGTKGDAERTFYKTAEAFFNDQLLYGYTYTLYTDLNSGTDSVTPALTAGISVTFALNSHSFTGTLNLGVDTNKLDLAITGAGDLSGAKLVVKNGELDLSGWTGGTNDNRTLGGISAPETSTATVNSAIKLPTGCVLAEVDENGSENRVSGSTTLASLAGKTLKIVTCTHDTIDTNGKCGGCGQYFVAKLTKADGNTEYIPYVYSEAANGKAKLTALFGSDYVEDKNSSNGDIEVMADSAFGKAKASIGSTLTLLTGVSYNDGEDKTPCVSGGTFTLDLNGRNLEGLLRVKGNADVTIKDSTVSADNPTGNGALGRLYIGSGSSLNGTVTIESGSFNMVNPNWGTVNITGGKIKDLTVSNGGVAKVSNANDSTIPEITALKYSSNENTGTATLKGGKYKKIEVSGGSKTCVDFLGENCAYFIGNSESPIDASSDEYNKKIEIGADSSDYCFVRSHTHAFSSVDVENTDYPKCACGYECHHPTAKVDATGKCSVCGKQLVVKETDSSAIVAYYPAFPATVTSGNKYTLLADLKADTVIVTNDAYADITIDLNGHSIVPATEDGTATLDITNGNVATIIGKGDLSKVKIQLGCTVVEGTIKCASVNLAAWEGVPADGAPANMTIAELSFTNLKKTDNNTSIGSIKYVTLKEGMTIGKVTVTYADDADKTTEQKIVRACNLLTCGCAFQNSDESYVAYSDNMANKGNLTVVKCPHTERTKDKDGETHTCKHCGQALVAELTKSGAAPLFYTDINDAFDAAAEEEGCTVTLLADSTVTTDMTAAGKFTLNLYGHTLTVNNGKNLNVTGDLTITTTKKNIEDKYGGIGGNVNVAAPDAKLTVSNHVKGLSEELETCTPTIGSLNVSNGTVALTGGKYGSLTVSGGTLTVANKEDSATVGEVNQTTTCIPEINILTVNGGDVKLTGGKYGSVAVNASGKTVGNLLGDTDNVKYGFKAVTDGTTTWDDSTSTKYAFPAVSETTPRTLTVEKLPIQSITTSPDNGEQTITYMENTNLQITEINGIDVADCDASFRWLHRDDDNDGTDLVNGDPSYIFQQSLNALTAGKTHKLYCDVTVDSYTKTVEFAVTVNKADLTIDEDVEPTGEQNLKYKPKVDSTGVYTGEGKPQELMTQAKYGEAGLPYEYSLDRTNWQKKEYFTQSEVGEYTVYWRICADGNHTINGGDKYESSTPIENVTISPLEITEVRVENLKGEKTYDGNTSLPQQGDNFKVSLVYQVYDSGAGMNVDYVIPLGGDAESIVKLEYADKNVGTPNIVAKLNPDCALSKNFTFGENITSLPVKDAQGNAEVTGEITPAQLKLTAKDKTVLVGQTATIPNPLVLDTDYEIEKDKIVQGDEAAVKAQVQAALTLKYCNMDGTDLNGMPDTSKVGTTYKIRPVLTAPVESGDGIIFKAAATGLNLLAAGQEQTPVAPVDTVPFGNYSVELCDGTLTVVDCVVTATHGPNGTISTKYGTLAADGTIHVTPGDNITFNITPNPGYVVASVTVDGVNLGALSTHTFQAVSGPHTIHATFMLPYANPQTGVEVG